MDELISQVAQGARIDTDKAQKAVNIMMMYLREKLPPAIADQVDAAVGGGTGVPTSLETAGEAGGDITKTGGLRS